MMKKNYIGVMTTTLVIGFVLALSGCATTQTDIARANAFCAANGGVTQIAAKYGKLVKVTCANSAQFTFSSNGGTQ